MDNVRIKRIITNRYPTGKTVDSIEYSPVSYLINNKPCDIFMARQIDVVDAGILIDDVKDYASRIILSRLNKKVKEGKQIVELYGVDRRANLPPEIHHILKRDNCVLNEYPELKKVLHDAVVGISMVTDDSDDDEPLSPSECEKLAKYIDIPYSFDEFKKNAYYQ